VVGAALMALGGITELIWGVEAARRSLEDVAHPISAVKRKLSDNAGSDEGGAAPVTAR
jgi:hypothetical protein